MSDNEPTNHIVREAKISGHIYSVEGAMLNGANVACDGMETKTLADGYFCFNGLAPKTYEVDVYLQGFKPTRKTVSIDEGDKAILDYHLSKARGTARICGHVYDVKSKKTIEQRGTVMLILPVANKYENINRDGYYIFDNLPGGTFKILTSIPGYKDCNITLTVIDGEVKTRDFFCETKEIEEPPWG